MVELLAKNEVLAPKALVDDEIRNLKAQMAQNMGQEGAKMNPDSFPDDIFQEKVRSASSLDCWWVNL